MSSSDSPGVSATMLSFVLLVLLAVFLLTAISAPTSRVADPDDGAGAIRVVADVDFGSCLRDSDE
jgi:hypothetical protein